MTSERTAASRAWSPGASRHVLGNGLRVLLVPDRSWGRVAAGLHHGVGYRHERPGEEGIAHLVEHLLFEGGSSVGEGRYRDPVNAAGGLASATTHQDYTDLYQVFSEPLLELVVFQEADRLREPRFSAAGMDGQLLEIEHEITAAKAGKPYAGLPWPLLPHVLFDNFQNSHDGYGEVDRLRSLSAADAAGFYWEHYAPENAVFTVVGSFDPVRAWALVQEHLGSIPARTPRLVPAAGENARRTDRWATCADPLVTVPGAAMGFRLPDPQEDLQAYLAHQVLAGMIPDLCGQLVSRRPLSTSCGVFGPLDTSSPDVLVVTAVDESLADDPARTADRLRTRLRELSPDGLGSWQRAVRQVAHRYAAVHHDVTAAARALGRYEILWATGLEQPALIDHALSQLGPQDLLAAAHGLAGQHVGGVVVVPGTRRSTLASYPTAPAYQGRAPVPPRTAPALPLPAPGADVPAAVPAHCHVQVDRLTMQVVRDTRLQDTLVRWRAPLGPGLWQDAAAAHRLTLSQESLLLSRVGHLLPAGPPTITTDGEWWTAAARVPVEDLETLVQALADVRTVVPRDPSPAEQASTGGSSGAVVTPGALAGAVQRADWARRDPGAAEATSDVLVVLTPGCPDRTAERVRRALTLADASVRLDGLRHAHERPGAEAPGAPGGILTVPRAEAAELVLELSLPTPATSSAGEAARYLATAVVGAYHDSRLVRRFPWRPEQGIIAVLTGRDRLAGRDRTFIRGSGPAGAATEILGTIAQELARLPQDPVTGEELVRARTYCRHQARCVLDSPSSLADFLVAALSQGKDATWLWTMCTDLARPDPHDVQSAALDLFAHPPLNAVLLGAVPEQARDLLAGHLTGLAA